MKTNQCFIMALCGLMLFAACRKEENGTVSPKNENLRTVTMNAGITATKVAVATDGKVTWTSGDAIAVYNIDGDKFELSLVSGEGESYGTFSGTVSGTLSNTAVYPASFAGDAEGTVVIPEYRALTDAVPAIMASQYTEAGGVITPTMFKHVAAVMEVTLKDVPAYACAVKFWNGNEENAPISGTFTVNAGLDGLTASSGGKTQQVIYFPYKTAYGSNATVKVRAVFPAHNYTRIGFRVLDGDEGVIEGTAKNLPNSVKNLSVGDYVSMKELDIRQLVGSARDNYVKVEGVKWAKGNLRAWNGGTTGTDWQSGWNIYEHQWENQIVSDPESAAAAVTVDGNKCNFSYEKKNNNYYHWDYFSWGTLARASRVHNTVITSATAEFDICGKVFSGASGDISTMTELTGDARFADTGGFTTNPSICGDLAFWASKGKYRLPSSAENRKLYNKQGEDVANANMKVGYYMHNGQKIRGVLLTSSPSWASATYDNTQENEFTDADLESGLFLPRIGVRRDNNSTNIIHFNNFGAYWSGTFGASTTEAKARAIAWASSDVNVACDMLNGYSINYNGSVYFGSTGGGNAIRPVLVEN